MSTYRVTLKQEMVIEAEDKETALKMAENIVLNFPGEATWDYEIEGEDVGEE